MNPTNRWSSVSGTATTFLLSTAKSTQTLPTLLPPLEGCGSLGGRTQSRLRDGVQAGVSARLQTDHSDCRWEYDDAGVTGRCSISAGLDHVPVLLMDLDWSWGE